MSEADTPALPIGMPTREVLSVGELTRRIKEALERGLGTVWLSGEVSNLRTPASRHIYLTLKDRDAQLRAVVWAGTARYLAHRPVDGDQVLCRGRLTVYEPRGDYQLIIDYLEPAGTGDHFRQIEATKAKLAAEGLLAKETKRELPTLPRRVGVVTSPSGAAVRDVLTVLGRRAPGLDVLVAPATVQGDAAPRELTQALTDLAVQADIDVIILARGGGSIEDLMAFNDEGLCRAIATCPVPVVAGVGHETDVTLADLAADLRAPTPSAAAELVCAHWGEGRSRVNDRHDRLRTATHRRLEQLRLTLAHQHARLLDPRERLNMMIQRLDDLGRLLQGHTQRQMANGRAHHHGLALRLAAASPVGAVPQLRERTRAFNGRLATTMDQGLRERHGQLAATVGKLQELSPLAVLCRGFALVTRGTEVVRHADQVNMGDPLHITLHQGTLGCRVEAVQQGDTR